MFQYFDKLSFTRFWHYGNPEQFNKYLSKNISFFQKSTEFKKCKIHLLGDFNLDLLKFHLHPPTEEFVDNLFGYGFLPTITKLTRMTNTTATLIDNIFTSSHNIGLSGIILSDMSDHNPVFAFEEISSNTSNQKIKKPDMSDINIKKFCTN